MTRCPMIAYSVGNGERIWTHDEWLLDARHYTKVAGDGRSRLERGTRLDSAPLASWDNDARRRNNDDRNSSCVGVGSRHTNAEKFKSSGCLTPKLSCKGRNNSERSELS